MPFHNPPPTLQYARISFPTPHILLVTLARPKDLNCINSAGHEELHALWEWMDQEPSMRVGIITGEGRAFCAGADLKEWNASTNTNTTTTTSQTPQRQRQRQRTPLPPSGFGGLSRRSGLKPIIVAANGLSLGGGSEMAINADLVIASCKAFFGFPEVQRGVVAWAGALPRLVRTVGRQRAMEMVLTGRRVSALEAEKWGFVNEVVGADENEDDDDDDDVVRRAVEVARVIARNSPDAVVVSREGVKIGWEGVGAEEGSRVLIEGWEKRLNSGENIKEGLRAFVEKREPRWVDSKL